jgi:hypothetical protein
VQVGERLNRTAFLSLVSIFLWLAAWFYLAVVPMYVARRPESGIVGYLAIAFGAFMFLQLWMVIALAAIKALQTLYGLRFPRVESIQRRVRVRRDEDEAGATGRSAGLNAVVTGLQSFLLTTYGFAIVLVFVSQRDDDAFGVGRLGVIDGIYYGFATAVTYGDLDPLAPSARLVVLAELVTSLAYTLLLFSILGGVIQDANRRRSTASSGDPE